MLLNTLQNGTTPQNKDLLTENGNTAEASKPCAHSGLGCVRRQDSRGSELDPFPDPDTHRHVHIVSIGAPPTYCSKMLFLNLQQLPEELEKK